MKINITQEDIDNGVINHICRCPAALAITRNTKYYTNVWLFYIDIIFNDHIHRFNLPKEVSEFIRKFDNKESVSPIEFELDFTSVGSC